MIALQIISKIIVTSDNSIVEDNLLTQDYFVGYENEFNFIQDHIKQYGNVPDKSTFLSKFPQFELIDVTESDRYLVDTVREEYLYYKSVPIIQRAAELLKDNSNDAAQYLIDSIRDLQPQYNLSGIDIVKDASERFDEFVDRKEHQEESFFSSGFDELDNLIHGIQRGEELFVLFARTNQGKSWVLEKICTNIWACGYNVGYISPEMGASSIGYRFDTLFQHYSNTGLLWGKDEINEIEYRNYISDLSNVEHKFIVSTPADFEKKITVTKVKNWATKYKLDAIAIDGITYMSDERYRRGDSKTTSLTNISEDLMELSMELKVPILVVVQANRTGVVDKNSTETPELESIRDSDGIAHNASKILSIHQKENNMLTMTIKKQRFGAVGGKLIYNWDINYGKFTFIPSYDDAESEEATAEKVENIKKSYNDEMDVF